MDDAGRLSFLGRQLPDAFALRVVTVLPGRPRAYQAAEWRDCLVVVESGELELEHVDGSRHRFGPGSLLALDSMPLRWLHAAEPGAVLLSAVFRRKASA
jgi:hypothetical protein